MALNFANNNSLSAITSLPASISGGGMTLIQEQTASSSATISFTSGIDSTYDEYVFKFYDVHPATDDQAFAFQVDTGTNTSYNQTITSTFFNIQHDESGSNTYFMYRTSGDLAQGTGFQRLTEGSGNDNDQSCTGTLHLYNPSNTTFVKNFIAQTHNAHSGNYAMNNFIAGYVNTTTALTRVRFKFESGNIDSGVIKLYGIS
jgi:hypothetical protein